MGGVAEGEKSWIVQYLEDRGLPNPAFLLFDNGTQCMVNAAWRWDATCIRHAKRFLLATPGVVMPEQLDEVTAYLKAWFKQRSALKDAPLQAVDAKMKEWCHAWDARGQGQAEAEAAPEA